MFASAALSCIFGVHLSVSSSPRLILVGTVVRAAASVVFNSVLTQQKKLRVTQTWQPQLGLQSISRDSPHNSQLFYPNFPPAVNGRPSPQGTNGLKQFYPGEKRGKTGLFFTTTFSTTSWYWGNFAEVLSCHLYES